MNSSGLVQLPYHEHGMVPRELSEDCSLNCTVCFLPLNGSSAYHCLNCENLVLIHKLCARFPLEIQHPSHPQHPLRFGGFTWSGGCHGCGYALDGVPYACHVCDAVALHARCATATLPPPEEEHEKEEEINYFAHDHPLASFRVNLPNKIECKVCRKRISGRVYGCRACVFVLHELCAQIPSEILHHPFHPQHLMTLHADFEFLGRECEACKRFPLPYTYLCNECGFILDPNCALNVSHPPLDDQRIEEPGRRVFHHFSHPHQLASLHATAELVIMCKLCQEQVSGDFYCCIDCNFMIHKSCADMPPEIAHPLHPDHPLILIAAEHHEPELMRCCYLCDYLCGAFTFDFHCEECSFIIDGRCAVQSLAALKAGVARTIQNFHEHQMRLFYIMTTPCHLCLGFIKGLAYCCQEGCPISFHITCAELLSEQKHPFHPQHPLVFLPQSPNESDPCGACLEQSSGYTYYCAHCEFQMHAACALRKRSVKHPRHEHILMYFEKTGGTTLCDLCCTSCNIDLYRCVPCNYNLHCDCMPLPKSVKHKLHIHPMELRDRFVIDYYEEQYCDLCETVRHPEHGVYHCDECSCSSHIDCVIPKVDLEQRILAEKLKLVKLDDEIATLEVKIVAMKKDLDVLMELREVLKKNRQEIHNNSTPSDAEPDAELDGLESCSSPRRFWDES